MPITTEATYLMHATAFTASDDTSVASGVAYFTRSGSDPNYVYTLVENPTGNPSTSNYYEATWAKLVDIKDFPDLGGAPGTVDSTDLSCHRKTSLMALREMPTFAFTCHGDTASKNAVKNLSGTHHFAVWFGCAADGTTPDGHNGKTTFSGESYHFIKGAGVDAEVEMEFGVIASAFYE